ncbi:MAG: hypothetical protein JNL98_35825, partial [Bryobacterales bacterium]|nr:hypothetical protein [Bryobacterales bacterium]
RPSLHSATGLDFRVSSLRFGAGPASKVFTLEYEAGTDFNQARFFSEAPVPTDVHLNLLTELETVLLAHSQAL